MYAGLDLAIMNPSSEEMMAAVYSYNVLTNRDKQSMAYIARYEMCIRDSINPTGKKRFQQALREGDMNYILEQALSQSEAGAQVLDVNVGAPGVDAVSYTHLDKPGTWSYIVSAMCAPALNTLFFMGYIVLAFYGCDYVQNLVSVKGAANPLMFVVLLVGVQGVAEFLVSGILGGIVARAVHKFLK